MKRYRPKHKVPSKTFVLSNLNFSFAYINTDLGGPWKLDSLPSCIPPKNEGYAMSTRRRFRAEFKAKVALEALRGDKTIHDIELAPVSTGPPGIALEA